MFLVFIDGRCLRYCARYSTDKKRVEENYDNGFECLKFDERERCPNRYPSTDAYKCKYNLNIEKLSLVINDGIKVANIEKI
uniref:Uncharacterized protein n=1 Tax=Magallana gigas TaxID=29159 RepID=K1Q6C3_MAGGI